MALVCPFKVGDRVKYKRAIAEANHTFGPFDYEVTVTEVTASGGFKWKTDAPVSMGARFGWFDHGECYNPAIYELVPLA